MFINRTTQCFCEMLKKKQVNVKIKGFSNVKTPNVTMMKMHFFFCECSKKVNVKIKVFRMLFFLNYQIYLFSKCSKLKCGSIENALFFVNLCTLKKNSNLKIMFLFNDENAFFFVNAQKKMKNIVKISVF